MPIYRKTVIVEETCSRCGGTGLLETMAQGSNANPVMDCPVCEGKGWKEIDKIESGILLEKPISCNKKEKETT